MQNKLTPNARTLRRNMTKEEKHLWFDFLRTLPVTVNRQKIIENYIVDFYCDKAKLVIELDGSQHYTAEGKKNDEERDRFLENLGLTVLRYSDHEINSAFTTVCDTIYVIIKERCGF